MKLSAHIKIEIGLKKAGFRTLGAWCRANRENYNTAYAAMHGLRKGPKTKIVFDRLKRAANV